MKKIISSLIVISMLLTGFRYVNADEVSDSQKEQQDFLDSDEYKEYLESLGRDDSNLNVSATPIKIYVSPTGTVSGDGSFEKPVIGLKAALEVLKETIIKNKTICEIQVIMRGGDYYVNDAFKLGKDFSGYNDKYRVVFMPYEDEKPVIKGSYRIDLSKLEPVTDSKILARLDSDSKNKIGVLNLKEQGITSINQIPDDIRDYTRVYLDGKEQMLSQWPNGDFNFSTFTPVSAGGTGKSGKGGSFKYENTQRPSRWKMANDIVISGFLGINFTGDSVPVASVDTDKSEILLKYGTNYGVKSCPTRRWKAINLLEEIDSPGEWYIDRDNMLLYYYPPYGLQNSVMEISDFGKNLFELDGVSNLTFKGIKFSEFCGGIFTQNSNKDKPLENFTIDHCDFENIGGSVLTAETYDFSSFWDLANWQYRNGNIKNIEISNNIFYNMGSKPIGVYSGSVDHMESDGFVFRNNYANQPSAYSLQATPDLLGSFCGYGIEVKNNLAHNGLFHAVDWKGSEIKINNNELSNAVRETMDSGTIYAGRSTIPRNNEIAYNYFVGAAPVQTLSYSAKHNRAIYFDDQLGGTYVHHNTGVAINLGGDKFISASGDSTENENNIIVGFNSGITLDPRNISFHKTLFEQFGDNPLFRNYVKKYNNIEREYNIHNSVGYATTLFGSAKDNYFVGCKTAINGNSSTMAKYNEYSGNIIDEEDELDAFVDPEHYDYRVKKSSAAYKQNTNLISEDYDLSQIGIQWDEFGKDRITDKRGFRKLYPANGETNVKTVNLEFAWEKAFDADRYRFVLATDPEFKNIVSEQSCMYNYCTVERLNSDYTDYYWTVYAINDTMQLNGEWEAYGAVHRFTTSKYEFLKYDELEAVIDSVTNNLKYVKDGTGGGTFAVGTREKAEKILDEAKEALKWKMGEKRQSDIDEIKDKLLAVISKDYLNSGFINLGDYIENSSNWIVRPDCINNVEFDNGVMKMYAVKGEEKPPTQVYAETQETSMFSQKSFFSFDSKIDFTEDSGFIGFSVRGTDLGTDLWACENYFFCIKKNLIEIQACTGGSNKIIKTIENDIIGDGNWHTISFGAYDCEYGQLMLLMIDNDIAANFMHTDSNQITKQGGIKFDIYGKINMDLKRASKIPDVNFDDMIKNQVKESLIELCTGLNQSVGKGSTLVFRNSRYAFADDKAIIKENAAAISVNDMLAVDSDVVKDMLNADVTVSNGVITIEANGKKAVYTVGDNICTLNGEQTNASCAPIEKNGVYYLPLRQLCDTFEYSIAYQEGLVVVNKSMTTDFANRSDNARKVILAMEKMRRLEINE